VTPIRKDRPAPRRGDSPLPEHHPNCGELGERDCSGRNRDRHASLFPSRAEPKAVVSQTAHEDGAVRIRLASISGTTNTD